MAAPPSGFPLAPPPFTGRSRVVEPGAGFDWLRQGWVLFGAYPGRWLGQSLLCLSVLGLAASLPGLGVGLALCALPFCCVGMLAACQRAARGEAPRLDDLLTSWRARRAALMRLGLGFCLGGALLALPHAWRVAAAPAAFGLAELGRWLGGFLLDALLVVVLSLPLAMAFCFAPALVAFQRMAPWAALKASGAACLKNWRAFLVCGGLLAMLACVAVLSLGLGFLVLIPVACGALHAAYRDIFVGV